MALGPGKYDKICTKAREDAEAMGCIVIVLYGKFGCGFSCQVTNPALLADLPKHLRTMADEIENSNATA